MGNPQNFTENLGNNIDLEMIYITGGTFMMGSPESLATRIHEVKIQDFHIGKYPITQEQYQQVMGNNPSYFKGNNHPVEKVSWDNAVEFCEILSQRTGKRYRLPSEAEWEYACRAGTITTYHFGNKIKPQKANYNNSHKRRTTTTPVGSYLYKNKFGLYDMHGNVWEWCQDDCHDNYEGAPTDGRAWVSKNSDLKVVRGGSWFDDFYKCGSAYHHCYQNKPCYCYVGFRVACS